MADNTNTLVLRKIVIRSLASNSKVMFMVTSNTIKIRFNRCAKRRGSEALLPQTHDGLGCDTLDLASGGGQVASTGVDTKCKLHRKEGTSPLSIACKLVTLFRVPRHPAQTWKPPCTYATAQTFHKNVPFSCIESTDLLVCLQACERCTYVHLWHTRTHTHTYTHRKNK
jgi:hypothetical protein